MYLFLILFIKFLVLILVYFKYILATYLSYEKYYYLCSSVKNILLLFELSEYPIILKLPLLIYKLTCE